MKKKLLIAAALLLVAAVGAYFCWPVRLLPAGEDLGELEIAYLEHSATFLRILDSFLLEGRA